MSVLVIKKDYKIFHLKLTFYLFVCFLRIVIRTLNFMLMQKNDESIKKQLITRI
jgi:hypothetical protein